MVKIDALRKMKLPELIELRNDASIVIGEKQTEAKDEFINKFKAEAEELGLDFNELMNGRSKRRGPKSGGTAAVKYRDPKNPANVWSGRGRPAKWLADYMAKGKKKEDFLVD